MNKIPSIFKTATLLLSLSASSLLFAQTYRWVDSEGVTHFSEQAPDADQVQSGNNQTLKPNSNQIAEKEAYLQERSSLAQQISGTISDQKREQLKRQLLILDHKWYEKYDPAKAEELAKLLEAPKVRVVPEKSDASNMNKYKAFY